VVSIGSININPKKPSGEPIVNYCALSNPIDLDLMVEYIGFYRCYLVSSEFAPYSPI
jgi:choline dehydrogenase